MNVDILQWNVIGILWIMIMLLAICQVLDVISHRKMKATIKELETKLAE